MQIPFESYLDQYGTKYAALYHAIKDAIVAGTLPDRAKLPSSRELAADYMLSRGTVNQVYDMLAAEGYVSAGIGSGTYVTFGSGSSEAADSERGAAGSGKTGTDAAAAGTGAGVSLRLSAWGKRVDAFSRRLGEGGVETDRGTPAAYSFGIGMPDLAGFPAAAWQRCLHAEVRDSVGDAEDGRFAALGHEPLREALARYLRRERGIRAEAADIAVTSGSMQALALLAQLLVDPGDAVVVENPGYGGIRRAVEAAGGKLLPADVDGSGLIVGRWDARLAFVTPSRHFPTGAVLSLERRRELLRWAAERGAIVVEDDYDSEFRHRGRPIEPLKALDQGGRVVYIGTFSKTMVPGLRLGYAVLPPGLREPFAKAKRLFEPHATSLLEQRALAAFMNSGQYERHLRRMKRLYSRKYTLLASLMRDRLGGLFEAVPSDAGLHLFAWWKHSAESLATYRQSCREAGVAIYDSSAYFVAGSRPAALFGFSHMSEKQIEEAIGLMAAAAAELFD